MNKYGFAETGVYTPQDTSRPGVYLIGAFSAPKDIPQSVAEASGAASKAGSQVYQNCVHYIAPEIPEINVAGQEPRVGVFVCDFGINIRCTVNCPWAVEYIKTLPNVVHSEEGKCTCSADFQ